MGYVQFPARYEVEVDRTSIEGSTFEVFEATVVSAEEADATTGKAHTPDGAIAGAFRRLFREDTGGILVDLFFYGSIIGGITGLVIAFAILAGGGLGL